MCSSLSFTISFSLSDKCKLSDSSLSSLGGTTSSAVFGEPVPTLIIERMVPVLATVMLTAGSVLEAVFESCCEVAEALIC